MSHHSLALILSLAALVVSVATQTPDLVIEVFRHGARGPIHLTYDPNPGYWNHKIRQFTPMGMHQQYILGAAIRDRYPGLLNSFSPEAIYVRSTDVGRTIMSAYSHMYGVFGNTGPNFTSANNASAAIPPFASSYVNDLAADLSTNTAALPNNYQPIPVHIVQSADDVLLAAFGACPMAKRWSSANAADPKIVSLFQNEMNDVVTYLRSQGLTINNFGDLVLAADNAIVNKFEGVALPGHIDPVTQEQYYKDLKFAFEWNTVKTSEGTTNQVQLYATNLLDFIKGNMNGIANGASKRKFIFLSGHDLTLLGLLSAFNIVTPDCILANYHNDKNGLPIEYPNCIYPEFASNVIFEMYNTTEPYIVFYYNGIQVPLCGDSGSNCTLKQFQPYINQVTGGQTPQDYLTKCNFPQTMTSKAPTTTTTITTVVIDDKMILAYKVATIVLAVALFIVATIFSFIHFRMYKKCKKLREQWHIFFNKMQPSEAIPVPSEISI